MQCISPLKASQRDDLSITYSFKESIRGLQSFQFDCRRCLPCRLNQAREKAIRALHEAKMHEDNIFLTLTYDDDNLGDNRLNYQHIQTFMDSLRNKASNKAKFFTEDYKEKNYPKIPFMVTGEYGDKTKRMHWHILLFNYRPHDQKKVRKTELGETLYKSQEIADIWPYGLHEFGSVTLDSASYVARYAAKKLTHGKDQDHNYHPIHKTSSRYAIGKSWIEQNFKHTFENGYVTLPNGSTAAIPRYYIDWVEKNHPNLYIKFITEVRPKIINQATEKAKQEETEYVQEIMSGKYAHTPRQRSKVKETILKSKFKKLQENLKL